MKFLRKSKNSDAYAYGAGSFLGETAEPRNPASRLKIVFFGSGPVAAQALELLVKNFSVEAVVTKPKPAHHRDEFPVLEVAARLGLPVETVSNKQGLSALVANKSFKSQVGVLIDFGIIVGQDVIDFFPRGIINSHFSILPQWRGADPISFAILSGQATTGVSLMLLVKAMDEGPLIAHQEHPVRDDDTTESLTNELVKLSDRLLREHLPEYVDEPKTVPQTTTGREVSYSRKLTKQDGVLDWRKPAIQLEREVRAFCKWPKSMARLAGRDVIVTKASVADVQGPPGKIVVNGNSLLVCTADQALVLDRLKPAGKQEMTAAAFLAGYRQLLV